MDYYPREIRVSGYFSLGNLDIFRFLYNHNIRRHWVNISRKGMSNMGIISTELRYRVSQVKSQQIIQIADIYKAHEKSEEDIKTIKTPGQFEGDMHPSHAVYASTQNIVSYLAENLSVLPELEEYHKIAGHAEDEYMPGYPPMSPLTKS